MSMGVLITIGVVFLVVWGVIGWEMYNAPIMPDDYENYLESEFSINVEEEAETRDAPPTNEKSPPKSQTYRGTNRNVAGFPPTVNPGDDIWMADEAKFQTLRDIQTLERRLQDLRDYSDIAFESSAQREYERVEKQLILLKETLPSA